jgi:hypothetical protein
LFLKALKSKLFSFFRIKNEVSHPHKTFTVDLLTATD